MAACGDGPRRAGETDLPPRCGDAAARAVAGAGYGERGRAGAPAGGYTVHEPIRLEGNKMGIGVHSSNDVVVRRNTIETTRVKNSLRLERVGGAEIAYNHLADNGVPEWFWVPGQRDIGIHLVRSDDVEVHDNVVLRSSSDGIAVSGQTDGGGLSTHESDWTGTASRIRIHNNLILDNMAFGIWLVRARDLSTHHNTIRNGCFTHGPGIGLDFDVDDTEVHANQIVTCLNGAHAALAMSHDSHIHDNVHFSPVRDSIPIGAQDDAVNDAIKAGWAGLPFAPSSGNRIESETHFELGGELRRVRAEKLQVAEAERTWEEQGRFSCESTEGVFDEGCVAAHIRVSPHEPEVGRDLPAGASVGTAASVRDAFT